MRDSMARLSALCLLFGSSLVFAADAKPVAKVGNEAVSAEALVRRLARVPQFQRAALASDPTQLKKQVLEGELVPDVLYAAEATRLQLEQRPGPKRRLRELLRDAMDRELKQEALGKAPVTDADVRAYFDENRSRFEIPKRLRIWRILVLRPFCWPITITGVPSSSAIPPTIALSSFTCLSPYSSVKLLNIFSI